MRIKKLTSWFLTICLLITQILTPDLAQAASLVFAPAQSEAQSVAAWEPSTLTGKVTQRVLTENSKGTIIHIQDAHAVFEAQKNIQSLIAQVNKVASAEAIFIEGGIGKLDPQMKHFFPDGLTLNPETREAWMKEGHLTGAEAYLMENQRARGFGIEEMKSYWDNVELYRRVDAMQNESAEFLKSWYEVWQEEAGKNFKPSLKKYLQTYAQSQVEVSASALWFDALSEYIKAEWNRDLSSIEEQIEFPMLTRYIYLKKMDGTPDFSKIEKQKQEFFASLKGLDRSPSTDSIFREIDNLIEKSKTEAIDFSGAREAFEQLAAYLPDDFSIERWPDLKKLIERIILAGEMDSEKLLREAKRLHIQVIKKDAQAKTQRTLALLLEKQILLTKLLSLELTREDFQKTLDHPAQPQELAAELERISNNAPEAAGRIFGSAQSGFTKINQTYNQAVAFYQGAINREAAMERAILEKTKSGQISIVVTGGFHKEGMESFARQQNWNYVSVMPRISKIQPEDFAHYRRALLGEGSARSEMGTPSEVAAALLTSAEVFKDPRAAAREEAALVLSGSEEAMRRLAHHDEARKGKNAPRMKKAAERPRTSDRPLSEWEGARARPSARSETRLQEAIQKLDQWKLRHQGSDILERYESDPFMTRLEAQASLIFKQLRLNELTVGERAQFVQSAFGDVQPAVSDFVAGWIDSFSPEILNSADPIDYKAFHQVSSNMSNLEYRYSLMQNQMIRTAGNLVFDLSEQEKRFFELEYLWHEFDKEMQKSGTGDIPVVAAMQDLHGGTRRALGLIAKLYGLPPDSFKKIKNLTDLKRLLDEQNLSTASLSGRVVGFSDLVDRGDDPVGAMELAREFNENSLGRFILGNHDLWRIMGVLGVHQLFGKEKEEDFDVTEKADHPAWWAWEAFHHAGWGDRELEQLNERRINSRIREANSAIQRHNQSFPDQAQLLLEEVNLEAFGEELNKKLKEAKKKNEAIRGAWQKAVVDEDKAALADSRPKKTIREPEFVPLPDVFQETLKYTYEVVEKYEESVRKLKQQGVDLATDFKSIRVVTRDNYQQDPDVLNNMLWQVQKFRLFYIDILGNLHMHNIIPMDYEAGGMAVHYRGLDGIAALELMTKDIREFFEQVTIDDLMGPPEKISEFRQRMWNAVGEAFTIINSWYSDRVPVAKAIAVQKFIQEGNIEWYLGSAGAFVDREISGVVFWGHNEAKKFVEANLARFIIYPQHGSGLINIDGGMSKGYENRGLEVTFGLRNEAGHIQGLQAWGYHSKGTDQDTETVVDLTRSGELTDAMSDEQKVLLGHLTHGPTYLRWQRHKILTLLDRGLESFLRSSTGQRREKIVKLRKLQKHVHEHLKSDKDPLRSIEAVRSIAPEEAVQTVDFSVMDQIESVKTWKEAFSVIEKILALPTTDLAVAALKRFILKVRFNGAGFEFAQEHSSDDYSDDIYEKGRELGEKIIEKYADHPELVRHFVFSMPFDLDRDKKNKRELWGLAADFDDRWMRDEDGGETGYANTLRRLIHRAGFSFSKAMELVQVYIDYLTNPKTDGAWENVRRVAVVNFPSAADRELRDEVQKQMSQGKSLGQIQSEPFQILWDMREKILLAQNGIRHKEFFDRWQRSLLAQTHPEIQPWIDRILRPQMPRDDLYAVNEAMNWVSELGKKQLPPEIRYEQIHFYQSLGSILQDLIPSYLEGISELPDIERFRHIAEVVVVLQPMLNRLRDQGYLTRDSKDWIVSLQESSLQLDQIYDLLQKIREDISFFTGKFFDSYNQEAHLLFGENTVTLETTLNMLLKEEQEVKLAGQLIEVLSHAIQGMPMEYRQRKWRSLSDVFPSTQDARPQGHAAFAFFNQPQIWMNQNTRRIWGGEKASVLALARNRLGVPVPPGFVVPADFFMTLQTSQAWGQFNQELIRGVHQIGKEWNDASSEQLRFGDPDRPLFLAVRSGSTFVMPGQLATFIMIGMTRPILKKMIQSDSPKEGYLAYYYFLFSAAELLDIPSEEMHQRVKTYLESINEAKVQDLQIEQMRKLTEWMERLFAEKQMGENLEDLLAYPDKQLFLAASKVRQSWDDEHARAYRVENNISEAWGTPLIVQKYVLGSSEKKSGSGLARSRNSKGEKILNGDWLAAAQGLDLVSGFQTPRSLDALAEEQPVIYDQLRQMVESLEAYFGRPVLVEFTVSNGRLWILQVSRDKSVKSLKLPALYLKDLRQQTILGQGASVYASSGGFRGKAVYDLLSAFDADGRLNSGWLQEIQQQKLDGLIWIVESMTPKKTAMMLKAKKELESQGLRLVVVSSEGGALSHAATSAAEGQVPAVVGVQQMQFSSGEVRVLNGAVLLPKSVLTIKFDNGSIYYGRVPLELERSEARSEIRLPKKPEWLEDKARANYEAIYGKNGFLDSLEHKIETNRNLRKMLESAEILVVIPIANEKSWARTSNLIDDVRRYARENSAKKLKIVAIAEEGSPTAVRLAPRQDEGFQILYKDKKDQGKGASEFAGIYLASRSLKKGPEYSGAQAVVFLDADLKLSNGQESAKSLLGSLISEIEKHPHSAMVLLHALKRRFSDDDGLAHFWTLAFTEALYGLSFFQSHGGEFAVSREAVKALLESGKSGDEPAMSVHDVYDLEHPLMLRLASLISRKKLPESYLVQHTKVYKDHTETEPERIFKRMEEELIPRLFETALSDQDFIQARPDLSQNLFYDEDGLKRRVRDKEVNTTKFFDMAGSFLQNHFHELEPLAHLDRHPELEPFLRGLESERAQIQSAAMARDYIHFEFHPVFFGQVTRNALFLFAAEPEEEKRKDITRRYMLFVKAAFFDYAATILKENPNALLLDVVLNRKDAPFAQAIEGAFRSEIRAGKPSFLSKVQGHVDGRLLFAGAFVLGIGLLQTILGLAAFKVALGLVGAALVGVTFFSAFRGIYLDAKRKAKLAQNERFADLERKHQLRSKVWTALDAWPAPAIQTWIEKEESAAIPDLSQIRDHYVLGALHFKKAAGYFRAGMDAELSNAEIARGIRFELKIARDEFQRVDYDRDAGVLLNALNRLALDSEEPSPALIHFVEYFILARLRAQPRKAWADAPLPQGGYVLGKNPTSAELKNYLLPLKKNAVVFLLPGESKIAFKLKPLYRDLRKNKNNIRFVELKPQDYASREALIDKIRQTDSEKADILITPFAGLMPEKNNPYPAELQRYFEDAKDLYEVEIGKRVDQIFYETDLVPTLANYFVAADEKTARISSQSLFEGHKTQEFRTPYSVITVLMAFVAGTLGMKKGILKFSEKPTLADAFYRTGIYGDERPQQPNEPSKLRRIFLVSPHPDDDVIAAKAVLAEAMKLAQEGEVVAEVIVMQPGENGVVDLNETQMKEALRLALGYDAGDLNAARVTELKKAWGKTLIEIRTLHENVLAEYKERYPAAAEKFKAKLETFKGVDFDALFDAAANQAWSYEELAKSGIQKKEINQATQALLKETAKYFIRRIENQRAIDFFNEAYPGKIRAQFFPEFLGYPSSGPQDLRFIHELEEHAAVVLQHLLMKFERSVKDAPKEAVISIVAPHRVDSHPHHVGSWKVINEAMKLWSTQASRQSSRDVEVLYYFAPWSGNLPAYHLSPQTKKSTNADLLRALIAGELTASRFGLPSPKELQTMQAQRYLVRPSILNARSEVRSNRQEKSTKFFLAAAEALKKGDRRRFESEKSKLEKLGMRVLAVGNSEFFPENWKTKRPRVYTRAEREEVLRLVTAKVKKTMTPQEKRQLRVTVESQILAIGEDEVGLIGVQNYAEGESSKFNDPHLQVVSASDSSRLESMTRQLASGFMNMTQYGGAANIEYQVQYLWWGGTEAFTATSEQLHGGSYSEVHRFFNPDGSSHVVKTADPRKDGGKLLNEAKMIQSLPEDAAAFFPKILKVIDQPGKTEVWMEDLQGASLTGLINSAPGMVHMSRKEDLLSFSPFVVARQIYSLLLGIFYMRKKSDTPDDFAEKYHFSKLEKRWQEAEAVSPAFKKWINAPYVKVYDHRGQEHLLPNFKMMLRIFRALAKAYPDYFKPPYLSYEHGDLHFGNIMADIFDVISDKALLRFKLIDPKWMPEGNDPLYDFAKLLHNLFGHYDLALDHSDTYHFNMQDPGTSADPLEMSDYVDDEAVGTLEMLERTRQFQIETWDFLRTHRGAAFPFEKDPVAWRVRLLFTEASLIAGLFPFHIKSLEKTSILYERALTLFNNTIGLFASLQDSSLIPSKDKKLRKALRKLISAQQAVNEPAFVKALSQVDSLVSARSESRERYQQTPEQVSKMVYPFQSIAHISYEMAPFFKRGGLADVAGDLPPEMINLRPGMDVAMVMPYHKDLKLEGSESPRSIGKLEFEEKETREKYEFEIFYLKHRGVNVFFLAHPDFFQLGYNNPDADRERIFFAKAATEFMVQRNLKFDVIHAHDQAAALVPAFVRYTRDDFFKNSAVIYTAHHFSPAYQGRMDLSKKGMLTSLGMPDELFKLGGQMELNGHLNPVKSAIEVSDFVTTVSQAFAVDAVFSGLSDGLQGSLHKRFNEKTLVGINNGMNLDLWRPDVAPGVEIPFRPDDLTDGKAANKAVLQQALGLAVSPAAMLATMFARFDGVKGFDIVAQAAAPLLYQFKDLQFVFGGGGDPAITDQLLGIQADPLFKGRMVVIPQFVSESVIQRVLAAADIGFAPSRVEPHGLFQLQAKRLGATPITSNVHGLGETVYDRRHGDLLQTGIKFGLGQPALELGVGLARFATMREVAPEFVRNMRDDAMGSVRSWQQIAPEYFDLYTQAVQNRRQFIQNRSEARTVDPVKEPVFDQQGWSQREREESPVAVPSPQTFKGKYFVVLDDKTYLLESYEQILKSHGAENVLMGASSEDGLRLVAELKAKGVADEDIVVITDYQFKGEDTALNLINFLRAPKDQAVFKGPILIVSGSIVSRHEIPGIQEGKLSEEMHKKYGLAYLEKNGGYYFREQLLAALGEVIKNHVDADAFAREPLAVKTAEEMQIPQAQVHLQGAINDWEAAAGRAVIQSLEALLAAAPELSEEQVAFIGKRLNQILKRIEFGAIDRRMKFERRVHDYKSALHQVLTVEMREALDAAEALSGVKTEALKAELSRLESFLKSAFHNAYFLQQLFDVLRRLDKIQKMEPLLQQAVIRFQQQHEGKASEAWDPASGIAQGFAELQNFEAEIARKEIEKALIAWGRLRNDYKAVEETLKPLIGEQLGTRSSAFLEAMSATINELFQAYVSQYGVAGLKAAEPGRAAGRIKILKGTEDQIRAELEQLDANQIVVIDQDYSSLSAAGDQQSGIVFSREGAGHLATRARALGVPLVYLPDAVELLPEGMPVVLTSENGKGILRPAAQKEMADAKILKKSRVQVKPVPVNWDVEPQMHMYYAMNIDWKSKASLDELSSIMGPKAARLFMMNRDHEQTYASVPTSLFLNFPFFKLVLEANPEAAEKIRLLEAEIQGLMVQVDKAVPLDLVRQKLMQIQNIVGELRIPENLQREIREFRNQREYRPLEEYEIRSGYKPWIPRLIARLSTNTEDLENNPGVGAGVYGSNEIGSDLNTVSQEDYLKIVMRTFSSFWSWEAFADRRFYGISEEEAFPALVIQEMAGRDDGYSVLIHTAEPASRDPNIMMIELIPGSGRALTSPEPKLQGEPFRFYFDKTSAEVVSEGDERVHLRPVMATKKYTVSLKDGSLEPLDYRQYPDLIDSGRVKELVSMIASKASKIETYFGRPMDIECMIERMYEFVQGHPDYDPNKKVNVAVFVQARPQGGFEVYKSSRQFDVERKKRVEFIRQWIARYGEANLRDLSFYLGPDHEKAYGLGIDYSPDESRGMAETFGELISNNSPYQIMPAVIKILMTEKEFEPVREGILRRFFFYAKWQHASLTALLENLYEKDKDLFYQILPYMIPSFGKHPDPNLPEAEWFDAANESLFARFLVYSHLAYDMTEFVKPLPTDQLAALINLINNSGFLMSGRHETEEQLAEAFAARADKEQWMDYIEERFKDKHPSFFNRSEARNVAQDFLDWVKNSDFIFRLGNLNQIELLVRDGIEPDQISIASLLGPTGGFAFGFDIPPIFYEEGVTIINSGLYQALQDRVNGRDFYEARYLDGANQEIGRAFNHDHRRKYGPGMGAVKGGSKHSHKSQNRSEMRDASAEDALELLRKAAGMVKSPEHRVPTGNQETAGSAQMRDARILEVVLVIESRPQVLRAVAKLVRDKAPKPLSAEMEADLVRIDTKAEQAENKKARLDQEPTPMPDAIKEALAEREQAAEAALLAPVSRLVAAEAKAKAKPAQEVTAEEITAVQPEALVEPVQADMIDPRLRNLPGLRKEFAARTPSDRRSLGAILKSENLDQAFIQSLTAVYRKHYGYMKKVIAEFGFTDYDQLRLLTKELDFDYKTIVLEDGDLLQGVEKLQGVVDKQAEILKLAQKNDWDLPKLQNVLFGGQFYYLGDLIKGLNLAADFKAEVEKRYLAAQGRPFKDKTASFFGLKQDGFNDLIAKLRIELPLITATESSSMPAAVNNPAEDHDAALNFLRANDWNITKLVAHIRELVHSSGAAAETREYADVLKPLNLKVEFKAEFEKRYRARYGYFAGVVKDFGLGQTDGAIRDILKLYEIDPAQIDLKQGDLLVGVDLGKNRAKAKEKLMQKVNAKMASEGWDWNLPSILKWAQDYAGGRLNYLQMFKALDIRAEFEAELEATRARTKNADETAQRFGFKNNSNLKFLLSQLKSDVRSEMRGEQPSAIQIMTARLFAAGFLSVEDAVYYLNHREEFLEILPQLVSAELQKQEMEKLQSILGTDITVKDGVILSSGLVEQGFLAAAGKIFKDVPFAFIAQGEQKLEALKLIEQEGWADQIFIAESIQHAQALLKKHGATRIQGMALAGEELLGVQEIVSFTTGQLQKFYKQAGILNEVQHWAQIFSAFASAA